MNKNRILVISDIHGCFHEFKELLSLAKYDSSVDQLILLGDYMDRGKNSKEVIYFVKELVEKHGAVAIKGNHDQMFCNWLADPIGEKERYFRNGAFETIQSFLDESCNHPAEEDSTYQEWAQKIEETHKEIVSFIENLPYFYETDDFIFVHAGINPEHDDWKKTSNHELIWIRDPFLQVNHSFSRTIIHGHTPAIYLHEKADVYYGNKKIGIDGACVYGHQLNCLEIKDGMFKEYFVKANVASC